MSTAGLLRSSYLLYLSQPAADRNLYKAVKGRKFRSVVELGIGNGERTSRLIEVLGWEPANQPLHYTGVDLFEQRGAGSKGLTLKAAFAKLKFPGVKVRLVPGDPQSALARVANELGGTDLLIISADLDRAAFERSSIYLPRMLHADTLIFFEEPGPKGAMNYRIAKLDEITRLAANASRSMRRAA